MGAYRLGEEVALGRNDPDSALVAVSSEIIIDTKWQLNVMVSKAFYWFLDFLSIV